MKGRRLRHQIEVLERTTTRDSYGDPQPTYTRISTRAAQITPINSQDRLLADQVSATSTHRIRMWYFEGLTTAHRLRYLGRTFEIESIINEGERNRMLTILAHEGSGAAVAS